MSAWFTEHGIDAVFSVLTSVSTLEEAFRGAFDKFTARRVILLPPCRLG
ncbi:hypothetical protein LNQ52_12735 [Klebsiella pneumoniae subsp. pneumoniae]|nr:hypothetical protein [Klebsiella pneumoniae subsp. pneumoniae]